MAVLAPHPVLVPCSLWMWTPSCYHKTASLTYNIPKGTAWLHSCHTHFIRLFFGDRKAEKPQNSWEPRRWHSPHAWGINNPKHQPLELAS